MNITEIEQNLGYPLSEEQKNIINHNYTHPLSIVACAGSGKTTTIETKMIYDIINKNINPENILCVTFSKRSQQDMTNKYDEIYENIIKKSATQKPSFSTFHSLFKSLLDKFADMPYFDILTSHHKYQNNLMKALNYSASSGVDLRIILNEMFSYKGYLINTLQSVDGLKNIDKVPDDSLYTFDEYKIVMKKYIELKSDNMAIDFDDMQTILYNILTSTDKLYTDIAQLIIKYFNDTYQYVYIDEFQDISTIQNILIDMLLDGNYHKLIVVGDDDQSIYKFRGSNPEFILNFNNEFENAETLYLSTNYRCKENILNNAQKMIESNEVRFNKSINAFNKGGYFDIISDNDTSSLTLDTIKNDMIKYPDKSFAVLCRRNLQLSLIADLLVENNIPVILNRHDDVSLQNHYLYNELILVIQALKNNDTDAFRKIAHKMLLFIKKKDVFSIAEQAEKDNMHWFDILMQSNIRHNGNLFKLKSQKSTIENISSANVLIDASFNILKPYYKFLEEKKKSNQLNQLEIIVEHLRNLLKNNTMTFDEFLQHNKDKTLQLSINEALEEGLLLMTFHSAKGLEFDNVYIINANSAITPGFNRLASLISNVKNMHQAFEYLEEERRLFYVACTRAKEKLIVSHLPYKESIFVSELRTHRKKTISDAVFNHPYNNEINQLMGLVLINESGEYDDASHVRVLCNKYITEQLKNQLLKYNLSNKAGHFSTDINQLFLDGYDY